MADDDPPLISSDGPWRRPQKARAICDSAGVIIIWSSHAFLRETVLGAKPFMSGPDGDAARNHRFYDAATAPISGTIGQLGVLVVVSYRTPH